MAVQSAVGNSLMGLVGCLVTHTLFLPPLFSTKDLGLSYESLYQNSQEKLCHIIVLPLPFPKSLMNPSLKNTESSPDL